MTDIDEKPTLAERYAGSLASSNLRSRDSGRNEPIDLIAAMGWCGDGIGAMLLRLRTEYDVVHGEHMMAEKALTVAELAASRISAEARSINAGDHASHVVLYLQRKAYAKAAAAGQEAVRARALILVQLKTLASTKQALGLIAVREATLQKCMLSDRAALAIVGRCLDVWLDPTCPWCNGRGYDGGERYDRSAPLITCRECKSTGNRDVTVGRDDEERRFASYLLGRMGDSLRNAEKGAARRM